MKREGWNDLDPVLRGIIAAGGVYVAGFISFLWWSAIDMYSRNGDRAFFAVAGLATLMLATFITVWLTSRRAT